MDPAGVRLDRTPPKVHVEAVVGIRGAGAGRPDDLEIGSNNRNVGLLRFIGLDFTGSRAGGLRVPHTATPTTSWPAPPQRQVQLATCLPGDSGLRGARPEQRRHLEHGDRRRSPSPVLAPFWMQWWFVVLAALTLAGAFYFISPLRPHT
ncbi:MAG: hypothetical protein U5K31_12650 [Balneolaceae bacterium]|nr:hypothetical protein [Balneolaceae bacterium]